MKYFKIVNRPVYNEPHYTVYERHHLIFWKKVNELTEQQYKNIERNIAETFRAKMEDWYILKTKH